MVFPALFLLTRPRAVAFKHLVGVPAFPDHLLFQILCWCRCFLGGYGLFLVGAALAWPVISRKARRGTLPWQGRKTGSVALILFALTLPLYATLEWFAFQRFPFTPDEFAYLFQAKVLASGHLTAACHPLQKFFTSAFIAEWRGRRFSIMPPGWSFFLVPWVRMGVAWLAAPLLSSLSVVLVYLLGERIYDRTTGVTAALLTALSPFFLYMSGTFFAHPLSLFLVLLFTLGTVAMERGTIGGAVALGLGLVLGAVPVVHHFDVFLLLPFLLLLAGRLLKGPRGDRAEVLLIAVVSLTFFVVFTGAYDYALTGSPFKTPHEVYVKAWNFLGEIPRYGSIVGIHSLGELKARILRLGGQLLQLNLVLFPLAPLVFFLPVFSREATRWDRLLTAAVVCMFSAYLFYWCKGGFQFGPRYYYPAIGFFQLLVVRGLRLLHRVGEGRRWGRVLRGGVPMLFILALGFEVGLSAGVVPMVKDVADYARVIEDVGGWFERRGVRNSVVFLTPSREDRNTDEVKILLRVRNEPDFSDPNLTVSDRGAENRELMDFYPERRFFLYEIDIDRLVQGKEMRWREIASPGGKRP